MATNLYQIYINKVLQLAQTIVIKSSSTADALNRYLTDYFGTGAVDKLNPASWKYYLNLAGEYHPTDEPMQVVSMDTLETINFSKENLQLHRATARGYEFGTRQYQELVNQYPKQELLILGILYPADLQTAIAAPDGQILSYPSGLVEPNEYSLIARLQDWINGFKLRWTNDQYAISDELYPATSLGLMYLQLVPAILTLRLQACKTNEAHSFHIQQYLASHGGLDTYMANLTPKQALFLYRNIAYIERNTGQQNIFEWLVEHIMSERNLPLAEYVMRHDVSQMPTQLYPELVFHKQAINTGYASTGTTTVNLEQMLTKEDPAASGNAEYRAENTTQIQEVMENSLSNVVLTKVLESSMIDYSNSEVYTLEDALMNHWLFLSTNGYYNAFIGVNNPVTGERIPLTAKDAYTFMWYASCKALGLVLDEVPVVFAKRVQRIPMPSVDDLMSVADTSLVDRSIAQQLRDWQPTIYPMISTEAFYNLCASIAQAANYQKSLVATQEHMVRRGMVQGMMERLYSDNICQLEAPGTKYGAWFAERNIKIEDFSSDDLNRIQLDLVRETTGLSLTTTNSLKALQAAMIGIMQQLSSYSVQYLTEINNTEIRNTNGTALRIGDIVSHMSGEDWMPDLNVRVQRTLGVIHQAEHYEANVANILSMSTPQGSQAAAVAIQVQIQANDSQEIHFDNVAGASIGVHLVNPPVDDGSGIIPVAGIELYQQLTPDQQQSLAATALY